jgi:uncharacterized protein YdaU (DUF1376 family)
MYGKFNVHKLGHCDLILLGIPWLKAMNPTIDWAKENLDLPATEQSVRLEKLTDRIRKKNGLTPLFPKEEHRWKNSQLKKEPSQEMSGTSTKKTNAEKPAASAQPQDDSEQAIKSSLTPEKTSSKESFKASIEEVIDEEEPGLLPDEDEEEEMKIDEQIFNTTNDVWINKLSETFAPAVINAMEYPLLDDEFLVEYANDMTEIRTFENVSMDTPLTKDGTETPGYTPATVHRIYEDW